MSEEMRKEFAEALLNLGIDLRKFKLKENSDQSVVNGISQDYYDNGDHDDSAIISSLWYMWKTSRESMKPIKLPKSKDIYHMARHEMTAMIDQNECKDAITSAGYKVEE